jgi:hypothetical protein
VHHIGYNKLSIVKNKVLTKFKKKLIDTGLVHSATGQTRINDQKLNKIAFLVSPPINLALI